MIPYIRLYAYFCQAPLVVCSGSRIIFLALAFSRRDAARAEGARYCVVREPGVGAPEREQYGNHAVHARSILSGVREPARTDARRDAARSIQRGPRADGACT